VSRPDTDAGSPHRSSSSGPSGRLRTMTKARIRPATSPRSGVASERGAPPAGWSGDQGGVGGQQAADRVDLGALQRLLEGERRQDGDDPLRPHRLPGTRRPDEEELRVRTPAFACRSTVPEPEAMHALKPLAVVGQDRVISAPLIVGTLAPTPLAPLATELPPRHSGPSPRPTAGSSQRRSITRTAIHHATVRNRTASDTSKAITHWICIMVLQRTVVSRRFHCWLGKERGGVPQCPGVSSRRAAAGVPPARGL
jgi:hypothetical protein